MVAHAARRVGALEDAFLVKTPKTVTLCLQASIAAWSCAFVIGTGEDAGDPAVYPVPSPSSANRVFDLGPEDRYKEVSDLPWLDLAAGDLVRIHYRPTPYQGTIGLRARGTVKSPVRIYGVSGPNGELPTLTGAGAAAGANLAGFFNEYTSGLGVIVINGSWNEKPSFIEIADLRITRACEGSSYSDETGAHPWTGGSCGIWLKAGNVSVKGCEIYGTTRASWPRPTTIRWRTSARTSCSKAAASTATEWSAPTAATISTSRARA
jgi:hypothetical protein